MRHQKILGSIPGPWVDGGAYKGEFVEICFRLFPGKTVVAFEPIPTRASKLKKKFAREAKNLHIHCAALGAQNKTIDFYVRSGNAFSSSRAASPLLEESQGSRADVVDILSIPQVRLDQILAAPPGLIKLDIQGGEREALLGCKGFLNQVQGLVLELCQKERYNGQALAPELQALLAKADFVCVDKIAHDSPGVSGGLIWDAFFLNTRIAGEIGHEVR